MAQSINRKMTKSQVEELLVRFAVESPTYREALVKDPKSIIERQFGTSLGSMQVKTVVETPGVTYLVLPHIPVEGELEDREIEMVAGGKGDPSISAECTAYGGTFNTVNQIVI